MSKNSALGMIFSLSNEMAYFLLAALNIKCHNINKRHSESDSEPIDAFKSSGGHSVWWLHKLTPSSEKLE